MNVQRGVVVGGIWLVITGVLSGCGYSGSERDCVEGFTAATLEVETVASAKFECGGTFGSSYVNGEIALEVESQEEATDVIANIYRAYAGDLSIDGAPRPSFEFVSVSDPRIEFDDNDLNFNGSPSVTDMREKYCDDLDCESGVTK